MTAISKESRAKFRAWLRQEIGKAWLRRRLADKYTQEGEQWQSKRTQ